jgi:hypothetical protein
MTFRHSPSLQTIRATTSVDRHAERPFHPVATAATPTPARRAGRAADAFGHAIALAPCAGDLDGNGVVDSADLGAL